jgi:hypothetical protein
MAASNKNLDSAIQARFSGSECLALAVLVYCDLLNRGSDLLQLILQSSTAQQMASNIFPACFGPSMNTGLN